MGPARVRAAFAAFGQSAISRLSFHRVGLVCFGSVQCEDLPGLLDSAAVCCTLDGCILRVDYVILREPSFQLGQEALVVGSLGSAAGRAADAAGTAVVHTASA